VAGKKKRFEPAYKKQRTQKVKRTGKFIFQAVAIVGAFFEYPS
jgi:hypothetical protein